MLMVSTCEGEECWCRVVDGTCSGPALMQLELCGDEGLSGPVGLDLYRLWMYSVEVDSLGGPLLYTLVRRPSSASFLLIRAWIWVVCLRRACGCCC